jgi:hypothetical protein
MDDAVWMYGCMDGWFYGVYDYLLHCTIIMEMLTRHPITTKYYRVIRPSSHIPYILDIDNNNTVCNTVPTKAFRRPTLESHLVLS